ncbi:hypothetical protein EMIT0P218_20238 [Pseudomonas sp. IT-P218]
MQVFMRFGLKKSRGSHMDVRSVAVRKHCYGALARVPLLAEPLPYRQPWCLVIVRALFLPGKGSLACLSTQRSTSNWWIKLPMCRSTARKRSTR